MSKKRIDGVWVVECDWVDPNTEEACTLGADGEPAMFVDPNGGKGADDHFQCGRHHGIIPQAEKEEFQLPPDQEINEDVIVPRTEEGVEGG